MSKFLETLERYKKELGLDLHEAVPGSTPVMSPTSNPAVPQAQPGQNGDLSKLSIDELAKQEAEHAKTTQDITARIASNSATPQDYEALNMATTGLNAIQAAKAKLNPATKPGIGAPRAASTNPLVKPLV